MISSSWRALSRSWTRRGCTLLAALLLWSVAAPPAAAADRYYEVQPGDSLPKLALLATGDALRYGELAEANPDLLGTEGDPRPGMVLRLPEGWDIPGSRRDAPRYREAEESADPQGVSGDTIISTRGTSSTDYWDRLGFYPALREIDDEFGLLMLRAAYEGDTTWRRQEEESLRSTGREKIQQEILAAEVEFDKAKSERDVCVDKHYLAIQLLEKFKKAPDPEFEKRKRDIFRKLSTSLHAEQAAWEDVLWPHLTQDERGAWEAFIRALENRLWPQAESQHLVLLPIFRNVAERVQLDPEQRAAAQGLSTQGALGELILLRQDDEYRAEVNERERYRQALADVNNRDACVAKFSDAEEFLVEKRRKLVALQIGVGRTSGVALSEEARRIADRYAGMLAEVQLLNVWLPNRIWRSLWWRSGVALKLAGEEERGDARLRQAAAVAEESRLPEEEVPPSIDAWLRAAENQLLRRGTGYVHLLVPPTAVLTVDGLEVAHTFGEADLSLLPGVHRFAFWVGESDPVVRLVGVVEGGDHNFTWYESDVPPPDALPDAPAVSLRRPDAPPRRWHFGIAGRGGMTLGRATGGAELTVRYLPKFIGVEVAAGLMVPSEPFWLKPREELLVFVHLHSGLTLRWSKDRFSLVGAVGGYVDPLLGAGPHGRLEVGWQVRPDKVRLSLDATFGYDVAVHETQIPRYSLTGGFGVWF